MHFNNIIFQGEGLCHIESKVWNFWLLVKTGWLIIKAFIQKVINAKKTGWNAANKKEKEDCLCGIFKTPKPLDWRTKFWEGTTDLNILAINQTVLTASDHEPIRLEWL